MQLTVSSAPLLAASSERIFPKGIISAVGVQLPMSGEEQSKYEFFNIGYSANDAVFFGRMSANKNQGEIVDVYVNPTTQNQTIYFASVNNAGSLKVISISNDENNFSFTSDNGTTGAYSVETHKIIK